MLPESDIYIKTKQSVTTFNRLYKHPLEMKVSYWIIGTTPISGFLCKFYLYMTHEEIYHF